MSNITKYKRYCFKYNSDDVSETVSEYLAESLKFERFSTKTNSFGSGENWRMIVAVGEDYDSEIFKLDLESINAADEKNTVKSLNEKHRAYFKLSFDDVSEILLKCLSKTVGLSDYSYKIKMYGEGYNYRMLIVIGEKCDFGINTINMDETFEKVKYNGTHKDMERFLEYEGNITTP
ncbi:MAG: hypothetical protein LUG66_05160 [Clostridiales bacterium]|nr:hypothetical protein [Clostridiales bacterium]